MGKSIKKLAPLAGIALPLFFPGVGAALGTALGAGAAGSAASGYVGNALVGGTLGGIGGGGKGAALGALSGGLAGGGANALAGSANLGSTAQTAALSGALQGGGVGAATSGGDLSGALLGAATGGLGGYAGAGGFEGTQVGTFAGSPLSGGAQGPTEGSGLLGNFSGTGSIGGSLGQTGTGGDKVGGLKLSSLLNPAGAAYSAYSSNNAFDDIENQLLQSQQLAQQQFQPYAESGANALANLNAPSLEALQSDPGYQFRLDQGNQALERSLASQGLGQSGAALKAAQDYGQGLADQTYNDYFNRQSSLANQGFGASTNLSNIFSNNAAIGADVGVSRLNTQNELVASLLGDESLQRLAGGLF